MINYLNEISEFECVNIQKLQNFYHLLIDGYCYSSEYNKKEMVVVILFLKNLYYENSFVEIEVIKLVLFMKMFLSFNDKQIEFYLRYFNNHGILINKY